MIRPLLALPVVIYLWKVIVWDKVLGLGTTDAIGGDVGLWAGMIVTTDRPMCGSCEVVLPYIGLELGDPTVTFVDTAGCKLTMKNGAWLQ